MSEAREISFGSIIKLRHRASGQYLTALPKLYPPPSRSNQNIVVAVPDPIDQTDWKVESANFDNSTDTPMSGDTIRLMHCRIKMRLHSHDTSGYDVPINGMEGVMQEVTAYPLPGDQNDLWKLEVEGGGPWKVGNVVRLIHVTSTKTNRADWLHSIAGVSHSTFTDGKQAVVCTKQSNTDSDWTVEDVRTAYEYASELIIGARQRGEHELDLGNLGLANLPAEIGQLSDLRVLNLESNSLTSLPPEILNLTRLESVNISGNRLTALPDDLGQLPNLAVLVVDNNPLPSELARLGREGKLPQYFRELAGNLGEAAPFNEAKLIFVGPGEVGKTWLLKALQGQTPKHKKDSSKESTKGLEITRVPLDIPHPTEQGRTIRFNCWDFGGQDYYQITHQIFFSPNAIYLLVWKPRIGADPTLNARLERIQLSAGRTAKVFVVSTHADENVPAALGKDALKQRFGDLIAGFHAVDSAKGQKGNGIAELKEAIGKAAAELEGMDVKYPLSWHRSKREIRAVRKRTLTFKEFAKVCNAKHMRPENIEALAITMDVQGNAVYFPDAPSSGQAGVSQANNIVVLDPQWLAKAIAFVMEDLETRNSSGVLNHDHLKYIWAKDPRRNCPGYGRAVHGYLLWLMWKFDIAYKQSQRTSLVPELIHRSQPDDLHWTPNVPSQEPQATLICRIPQEPPIGLIPVLTAAVHPLRRIQTPALTTDSLDRNWRDGFFFDTAQRGAAFVELQDRDLRIIARHRYPSDLIRQVRRTLEIVVGTRWPNLQLDYQIPCIGSIGGKPCPGRFKPEYLNRRRNQRVSCQYCEADDLEVDKMLEGFDSKQEQIIKELRELKVGQSELMARHSGMMAVALRLYHEVLDPARNELERAPCMFTILPEEPGGWQLTAKLTEMRTRVTCWCQHPDGPHPAAPIDCGDPPDYVLKAPKEWLVKVAPYISWASTLLKAFLPLAGTVIKQGLDGTLSETLKNNLDTWDDISQALPAGTFDVRESNELETTYRIQPEIVALRHIHDALLDQVPKAKRWGDLRPIRTKAGQLLWLCKQHADIQQPPVPEL